jgi:putative transposase
MEKRIENFEDYKQEMLQKIRNKGPKPRVDDLLKPLFHQFIQEALEAEMEAHLSPEERENGNRRNGKMGKTVKSKNGAFELFTPRDRNGTFEPILVEKRQTLISEEVEEKVLSLYSRGMSVRDISSHIEDLYGFSISATLLSTITDRVLPLIQQWRERPLEPVYCFAWLDAMFYKTREDGKYVTKVLYNVIGVNSQGKKELLGMYLAESEGAKFWMQVLEDLKRRGVTDIIIASIDNLKGFKEAIEVIFPQTVVQSCIVHQIRNSIKYVAWKDMKAFMVDLKAVYQASSRTEAEFYLGILAQHWEKKYPVAIKSWKTNWERLTSYFDYPEAIRRVMYTTNIIEGFHRQVRKVTKTKGAFTSDTALLKLVFLATQRIVEKWQRPIANWATIASELHIIFGDRCQFESHRNF